MQREKRETDRKEEKVRMELVLVVSGLCLVASIGFVVWDRLRLRKMMNRLYEMLEFAMDGSFEEQSFDESKLSSIEAKMAQYLSFSETSARKVESEKEKIKTLIGDISHQTKTPIANILLYTELLQEMDLSEEEEDYINSLHSQTEKLNFLIVSLVKLSRLETGVITLKPESQKVLPMVEGIMQQYKTKAEEKGIRLYLDSSNSEEEAVFDEKWTKEAIGNMIDNAIKYTREGSVKVAIKPYELFVCVEIKDTGIGIEEKEKAKIFQRFYRSSAVKKEEGVGIGLYLAREVLQEEGGYIKVSSKPGEGTVFSVYLSR